MWCSKLFVEVHLLVSHKPFIPSVAHFNLMRQSLSKVRPKALYRSGGRGAKKAKCILVATG